MAKLTLNDLAKIIKSEISLVLLALLAIGLTTLVVISLISRDKTSPQSTAGVAWQDTVVPGSTTKEELEAKLGPPKEVTEENGQLTYAYESGSEFLPHTVSFDDNKVTLVKEKIIAGEQNTLDLFRQKYGPEDTQLYEDQPTSLAGYFWGELGLLIFANKIDGTIFEIWYFPPTSYQQFLLDRPELNPERPTGL